MVDEKAYAPELSIVIPAYNAQKFIVETLRSLMDQTAKENCYEVIVVDDGSTDDTLQLCQSFAQDHTDIRVVHQENAGVSAARNAGIELATGKWLAFVDSDDRVQKDYVETLLCAPEDAQYVILDNFLSAKGKQTREKIWLQPHFDSYVDKDTVLEWICDQQLNAPWDKRFSLELIKAKEIRFAQGLQMGEDALFNLAYVMHAKKLFVYGKAVYIHEDNAEGLCNRRVTLERLQDHERLHKEMCDLCAESDSAEKLVGIVRRAMLRVVTGYAGRLHRAGIPGRKIAAAFRSSKLVQDVLAVPTGSLKDSARKMLLKQKWYGLCANLFL